MKTSLQFFFKTILFFALFIALVQFTNAQYCMSNTAKCIGGSGRDSIFAFAQEYPNFYSPNTAGYLSVGSTNSTNGDVSGNHGNDDYLVVQQNVYGNNLWVKSLGGSGQDVAHSVAYDYQGGAVVVGYSNSNDGNVIGNHGGYDYWVVHLDGTGNIVWQKSYGGSGNDYAYSIQETSTRLYQSILVNGYIVAGYSNSNDGDVTGNHGGYDYWVTKLDTLGNIQWQKSLGGSKDDKAYSVAQTVDGGFLVSGSSNSNDGNVSLNKGGNDYWIIKLDSLGNVQWQKSLGGSGDDVATGEAVFDNGYVVCGYSNSVNGDITDNHGGYDYWVTTIDTLGNTLAKKSFGGSGDDKATSIDRSGFFIGGYSNSTDGDVFYNNGGYDYWIVGNSFPFNPQDSIIGASFSQCYGGSGDDKAYCVIKNEFSIGGGYCVVFYASGYTTSTDGDVIGNHGGVDGWITGAIVYGEPVVLSSFSASLINKEVLVKWASATEINSDNYEVQHSIDGTNFSIVGKVKSLGNANKYQFTDKTPNEGINYYRLKMIDKDGSFTYSKIVSVQLNVGIHPFSVVPNPAKDFTTIRFAKIIDKATIAVYDITGKAVIKQLLSGSNDYKLNTQSLVNGVYLIKVSTAAGSYNEKLFINK